jgi:dTDP-4-amino-4,6-dideoxy-D-galactose acyltransferase
MTAAQPSPCELLPWDSEFFKVPIGRVSSERLSGPLALRVDQWAEENRIRCLYFLAVADDPATLGNACEFGYNLVDIRLTLECREPMSKRSPAADALLPQPLIRAAQPQDLTALQAMARTGHRDTRFFSDTHFSAERAEQFYSTWIALECQGRATQVLVAVSSGGDPQGYISCHLDPGRPTGQIGLVGVSSEVRGKGIGKALVTAALDWFASNGALEVIVVTQGRNIQAQRLYQRCGFVTQKMQLWFHKWFPNGTPVLPQINP